MGLHDEAKLDRKFMEYKKTTMANLNLVSVLGHARRTHSLQHMLRSLREARCELYHQLPKVYR